MGKSTLLRKLLERWGVSPAGFVTVKAGQVCQGRVTVHLLRLAEEERPAPENLLFFCDRPWTEDTLRRFDALGCAALADCAGAELLVMDELGPAESRAERFQAAVWQALDGDIPVVGVLQRAESAFLQRVAQRTDVEVIEVTAENRDTLLQELQLKKELLEASI